MEERERFEGRQPRRGGLAGPLFIISLGVILLLNNLGIVDWNIWELLFRLWPVFLITAGVDLLIGRRSLLGSIAAFFLIAAILVGALWLFSTVAGQEGGGQTFSQPLGEATEAEIVLSPAMGMLQVEAFSSPDILAQGAFDYLSGETVFPDFSLVGKRAQLTLESEGTDFFLFGGEWGGAPGWDVELTSEVPLELDASLGFGQSIVDLTGADIENLEVSIGMGQVIVTLPSEGAFDARVDGGVGHLVVVIPEGMAARIEADTGMVGRQFPSGYHRLDGAYVSPGYETAENRVNLRVDLGVGAVTIRQGD